MKIGEPVQISTLPAIPWKNGGGITRNLAVEPEGAGFDQFLWRLSFAEVSEPGRFSIFPGVDRTILAWKGNGLRLHTNDGAVVPLTRATEPYAFRGEDEIEAMLIDGPAIDFNVMVRRGRCTAAVDRYASEATLPRGARQAFFLCATGSFRVRFSPDGERTLLAEEGLQVSDLAEGARISPAAQHATMIVVLIDPAKPDSAATD